MQNYHICYSYVHVLQACTCTTNPDFLTPDKVYYYYSVLFYPYPLTQKVVCSPVQHLRVQQCVELSHDVDNYLSGSPQIVLVLVQIWQPVILIQPPGILHRNLS